MEPLVQVLPKTAINEKLIPALVNLSGDKTWRIRLAVVQFMPTLVKHIERQLFADKIEANLVAMMTDPVFTIRDESTQTLLTLSESFGD